MGMTVKEAIGWIKMQSNKPIKWDDYSKENKQIREEAERRIKEAFDMAIKVLKAQEPMKPVAAIDNVGDWLCGNCYQSVIGTEELDASGFLQVKYNYCPNCGRAVKWDG